jgi:hypothetical protein
MMFSFGRLQRQAQITAIFELVEGSVLLARIDSADIPSGRGGTGVRAHPRFTE